MVALTLGGAALFLIAWMALSWDEDPHRHSNTNGPLRVAAEAWTMALDADGSDSGTWTLGIPLCADSETPIELKSVRPAALIGEARFLGARVREFAPTAVDWPITSIAGYPPDVPHELVEVDGFTVESGCSLAEREQTYVELLVGIGRVGTAAGGWLAEEITYVARGREYVLTVDIAMLVCGPVVPAAYCKQATGRSAERARAGAGRAQ